MKDFTPKSEWTTLGDVVWKMAQEKKLDTPEWKVMIAVYGVKKLRDVYREMKTLKMKEKKE